MADEPSDEQLRRELKRYGEKSVGPITETTRKYYLKKLNNLRLRHKQAPKSQSRSEPGKKIAGFSSDESDGEGGSGRPATAQGSARPAPPTRPQSGRAARAKAPRARASIKVEPDEPTLPSSSRNSSFSQTILSRPSLRRRESSSNANLDNSHRGQNNISHSFAPSTPDTSMRQYGSLATQTSFLSSAAESFESSDSDYDATDNNASPEMASIGINTSSILDASNASRGPSPRSRLSGPRKSLSHANNRSLCRQPNENKSNVPPLSYQEYLANHSQLQNHDDEEEELPQPQIDEEQSFKKLGFKTGDDQKRFSIKQHISMFLVIFFALFFISLAVMYWNMREVDVDTMSKPNLMICKKGQEPSTDDCFTEEQVFIPKKFIVHLSEVLGYRAGQHECGDVEVSRSMTIHDVEQNLKNKFGAKFGEKESGSVSNLDVALRLMLANPQWHLRLLDNSGQVVKEYNTTVALDSNLPLLSLWCRLQRSLTKVFNTILLLLLVAFTVSVVIGVVRHRWRKQAEETRQMYELVEEILNILRQHSEACQKNSELKPYVAIPHLRDMLIAPKQRKKKQRLWDAAVKFLSSTESRIREERHMIEGEEFAVWKWLQKYPNGTKVWQGQAFENSDTSLNMPTTSPSSCLKIRNMFDSDMEFGEDWHVHIQDAILEKCGSDHGVVHIEVDKTSREGLVYVKCESRQSAGQAFRALHGWWFDGSLVTVRYLRLERYHERFPHAINYDHPMDPSNNKKLSLSHPYHTSIIESS